MMIGFTKDSLFASFHNRVAIKSGGNRNLIGGDNFVDEESMDKYCVGHGLKTFNFHEMMLIESSINIHLVQPL